MTRKSSYIKILGWVLAAGMVLATMMYLFLGVGKFTDATLYIKSMAPDYKEAAIKKLSNQKNTDVYSGILGQTVTFNERLVALWIWDYRGIKFFKIPPSTKFSRFSLCQDQKWKQSTASVSKSANMDYKDWIGSVKQGDFVEIIMEKEGDGKVNEITYYDWWIFAHPIPYNFFEKRC